VGAIKKFTKRGLRSIVGGRSPVRIVEELIVRKGFDPDACKTEDESGSVRWMFAVRDACELEILIEGKDSKEDATVYLGLNVLTVPIRGAGDVLAAALEVADGLIGVKVSLVGHYLVLSAGLSAQGITVEDLEYHVRLIEAQESWFRDAVASSLGWDVAGDVEQPF
jgi:hypothetical protein